MMGTMSELPTSVQETDGQIFSVDLAQLEDAEVLAEILSSAIQNKSNHNDRAWGAPPHPIEEVYKDIEAGNIYIARLGNNPVGTLKLVWEDEVIWGKQPPIAAYVHQLAVASGYHGLDLGKQLLDWAGLQASSNDRNLLRIDIPPGNEGLKNYYEKQGFKWVKDREVRAPHKTYTAVLCEKSLLD